MLSRQSAGPSLQHRGAKSRLFLEEFAMRTLLTGFVLSGCLLLSSSAALAGAMEASRGRSTMNVDKNAVTADTKVRYVGYRAGDSITVTLEYSASCTILFRALSPWKVRPFSPPRAVTGSIANVSGTPQPG